jgi:ribosomal protein S18 acetylase RimI-like enzyme
MEAAGKKNKGVHLHVEEANPAASLYRRLGFSEVERNGIHRLMEWRNN